MICPNEEELFAYVDGFLDDLEAKQLERHVDSCSYCMQQLQLLKSEKASLEEMLKLPVLPDNFAEQIVAQVQPYKRKRKPLWQWGLGAAASMLLAGGIFISVNPSFAGFVGSVFSGDHVDEGLNIAIDTNIATPVDIAVTDAGITLHVEHLIADTSRIVLSYSVTDSNGKKLDPYLHEDDEQNKITLFDQNNNEIKSGMTGWSNTDHHGVYEFSLVGVENITAGFIRIEATEIANKRGNWLIEVPVDLTAAYANQQVVEINQSIEQEGIIVHVDEISYATSTTDISYGVQYTDEAKQALQQKIDKKKEQFNEEIVTTFFPYHPAIGYRIENEAGGVLGYRDVYAQDDKGHAVTKNMIGGLGSWEGEREEMGLLKSTDSFVPQQSYKELYFVLDTIFKTKISDFSVTFKPEELPYTFNYQGYELTVDTIERNVDYTLRKSWMPINRQVTVEIAMSGYATQQAPKLDVWALEDENGQNYFTYGRGSILDETDAQGRFKQRVELISYDLDKVPSELTLHLIAEIEEIKLEEEWRVPLFQQQ